MINVNMNPKTRVRYGVIAANDVDPDFLSAFDGIYPDIFCQNCEEQLNDIYCQNCGTENLEYQEQEPIKHEYNKNGIRIITDSDFIYLTVLKSKSVFSCRACSPCFPNAGDLSTRGGLKTYGIPKKYLSENFKRD